ncbi:MAG TPA: hypothetical protein VJK54_02785 [Chthoniobacterales bacterium]|nr:hypothetical protein [Chthoniobacterales bacterium]
MFVMSLLALVSLIWPFHRMFWGIPISSNEGWNAFYADAAMGRMPLYPSLEQLITNNYPPLSFYVVGFFGKIIGDNVLAGRFISFGAVLIIAFLIGGMIKNLSSKSPSAAKGFVAPVLERIVTISSAVIGGSYFAVTMSCFFNTYVGMNDPQLLAEVIMLIGFCVFLHAYSLTVQSSPPAEANSEPNERSVHWWYRLSAPFVKKGSEQLSDHSYALAILIMVIAGFFKHNIITFPLVALFLLIREGRWRELVNCCCLAAILIVTGFILCYWCYGIDFFHNFLTPRTLQYSNLKMPSSWNVFYVFRAMYVGLLLWFFIRWKYYYAFLTKCLDYFTYSFFKHSINPSVECEGESMRYQSDPSNFNEYSDLPTAYSLQPIASIRPVGRIATMQLIDSIIVIGLLVHVLQRFGDGVWSNSGFDLLIGVSLAVGFSWDCLLNLNKYSVGPSVECERESMRYQSDPSNFNQYSDLPTAYSLQPIASIRPVGRIVTFVLPIVVLILLCNCLLRAPRFHSPSYLVSSEFQQELEKRKQYIAQKIDQVRTTRGDVFFEPFVVWRAGKPFVVDAFNVEERIKAGKLPHDIIEQKVKNHTLITIPWDSSKLFLE